MSFLNHLRELSPSFKVIRLTVHHLSFFHLRYNALKCEIHNSNVFEFLQVFYSLQAAISMYIGYKMAFPDVRVPKIANDEDQ